MFENTKIRAKSAMIKKNTTKTTVNYGSNNNNNNNIGYLKKDKNGDVDVLKANLQISLKNI